MIIEVTHSCDVCGRDHKDSDEMFCDGCRPMIGLTGSERMVLATLARIAPHSLTIRGNSLAIDIGVRLSVHGLVTLDHRTDKLNLADHHVELAQACLAQYPEAVLVDAMREHR